ncbi:MAG: tRNA (N6-isopentenyl adenosine(37)-C2)-methylthiotransferase MiaB [Phycisphaerales bacterium]|nr:MAG: tRNA (N6-isopentenyl adenosine(37)-C2)-methylthiotransferase MiaB [Phycisphaerales bacterium]
MTDRPAKTVYLETMGCQMNVLDSELVLGQLRRAGYCLTDQFKTADLVLLNTCSVRRHAEDKVYSRLGEIGSAQRRSGRRDQIVGVIGCMAERDRAGLLEKCPQVDILCGPNELNQIPKLVLEVTESRKRAIALSDDRSRKIPVEQRSAQLDSLEALDLSRELGPEASRVQAYVRVQRGCDKFCTYCVVPFTRGPERSRPPSHIVSEAKLLVDQGMMEITLLGQTVNSYVHTENGRTVRFAELLEMVAQVPGLERLRFVTSFPADFAEDILCAMRDLPQVCEYLHLPAQSGSNRVLRDMKRQHTVEHYDELIAKAREIVPGINLAGDFIVGFVGETEDEFAESVALVERTQYKNIFVFKYSPRPGTAADRRQVDDVPNAVKRRRNTELLAVQERISLANNGKLIGREVEILVEGYSKAAEKLRRQEEPEEARPGGPQGETLARTSGAPDTRIPRPTRSQLTGRTRGDQIVVYDGPASDIGRLKRVRITAASALTLHGTSV